MEHRTPGQLYSLPILLSCCLALIASTVSASSIYYVGRQQRSANSANASVTFNIPSRIQNGDMMLIFVAAWNSPISAPNAGSWTTLGSCQNSANEYVAAFAGIWTAGSPTSYTFNGLNYPKAIMRVYRGASGVDASVCAPVTAGTDTNGSSLTVPALPATTAPNDEYVGEFFNDGIPIVNPPADLSHGVTNSTQWASFDGDKVIPSQGSIPPAETASN